MRKRKPVVIIISVFLFFFSTCGVDTFYYLPPVDEDGRIVMTSIEDAEITLPSISESYFTNFTIFYRIYLSDLTNPGGTIETSHDRQQVNSYLESDFNYFDRTFIAPPNASPPTTASFTNRNYYKLSTAGKVLENDNIIIQIRFPASGYAHIIDTKKTGDTSDDETYLIYRDRSSGFSLKPDYDSRFFYSEGSNSLSYYDSSTGPNRTHNRDVVAETTDKSYEAIYVSMYIVTTGTQDSFQPLYSKPAHIGVFRLQ